jgi:hypothetical protein
MTLVSGEVEDCTTGEKENFCDAFPRGTHQWYKRGAREYWRRLGESNTVPRGNSGL